MELSFQTVMSQVMLGLNNGVFYAILSLGLAVIFGLLNIVNFVHGALYMLGAYVALLGYTMLGPLLGKPDFHLNYWAEKANVHLKFVLGTAAWCWTSEQLEELVSDLNKERVWIMAYGTDQDMRDARVAWDLALNLGVNYSDRLHIRLRRR